MTDQNRVARWLLSVGYHHRLALIHGGVTMAILFPLASQPQLSGLAAVLGCLIIPSQICLIAFWATLADVPLMVRVARAALWFGGLYFCVLGAAAINPRDFGRELPPSLALAMSVLLLGTAAAAYMMRQLGWRLTDSADDVSDLPASSANPSYAPSTIA